MKPRKGVGPPALEIAYRMTRRPRFSYQTYKTMALVLTFFSYFMYHATRKPPSIVKSVLKGDGAPGTGWAPFDGPGGAAYLGQVDLAFLAAYAAGMFFAGHAADRADLRVFLAVGMLGSGLLTSLVGMGYFWGVHQMPYYLAVQVAAGLFQSTGWPAVVAIMANWFGKGKRGLVMGVWNAHTSLGNIAGTVTAAACLGRGWGWSFVLPGLAMSAMGVVVFAALVPHPSDVGLVADGEGGGSGGGGNGGNGGNGGGGGGHGGLLSKQQQQAQYELLRSVGSQTACVRMGLGGGLGGSSGTLATATSVGAGRSSSRVRGSSSSRARGNGGANGNGCGSDGNNSNHSNGGGGGGGGSDSAEEALNGGALPVSGLDKGSAGHSSEDDETGLLPDGTAGGAGGNGVGNGGGGADGEGDNGGNGNGGGDDHGGGSVSFAQAWAIPGVASFAFALFFSKLIAYTFLYWLPFYIRATPIQGRLLSSRQAGDLSVLFDVGGVAGGVVAGHLSDKTSSPALVSTAFTLAAVPALWLYRSAGHASFAINVALMTACGFLVNGPYALITTAVSADLGSHESLQGNARALATVTAIIDGMGSVGAAIGPMLTGVIAESGGFDGVFAMLYCAATAAGALLVRMALKELSVLRRGGGITGGAGALAAGLSSPAVSALGARGARGSGGGGGGGGLSNGVQLVGLKV